MAKWGSRLGALIRGWRCGAAMCWRPLIGSALSACLFAINSSKWHLALSMLIEMSRALTKRTKGVCGCYLIIDYQIWSAPSILPEIGSVTWWLRRIHRVSRYACRVGGPRRTSSIVHLFLHLRSEIVLHRLFLGSCTSINSSISHSLIIQHIKSSRSRASWNRLYSLFFKSGSKCFTFQL